MALSARLPSSTRPHPVRSGRANRVVVNATGAPQDKGEEGRKESFIEAFFGGNLLDFSSWAPRSSRIWRLNQYDYEASTSVDEAEGGRRSERGCVAAGGGASWARQHEATAQGIAELQARAARQRAASTPSTSSLQEQTASSPVELPAEGSFSDADDDALSSALSQRIRQITVAASEPEASQTDEDDEEEGVVEQQPLSAEELRGLVYAKYGKTHDLHVVKRDVPGKTFVSLNIMYNHMEQRSFKLTEPQFMEKLDSVAYLLNALGQAELVRSTLKLPPKSQHGMPSRPVVGTAVSIQLPLTQAAIDEWFGKGYAN